MLLCFKKVHKKSRKIFTLRSPPEKKEKSSKAIQIRLIIYSNYKKINNGKTIRGMMHNKRDIKLKTNLVIASRISRINKGILRPIIRKYP